MIQLQFPCEEFSAPKGFSYHQNFISIDEEHELLQIIKRLKFESFEMHGVEARRKVIHYGMKYDFLNRTASKIDSPPSWLQDLKKKSEILLKKEIPQILVTYYPPGAPIGWHFDAPPFESLLGVSLLNPCRFLLRKGEAKNWEKFEITLGPRSAYVVREESRWEWQHHIPPVKTERYSITFRTLVNK